MSSVKVIDIDNGYKDILRRLQSLDHLSIKIGVQETDFGKKRIGIGKGKSRKEKIIDTDIPLAKIAAIHEFGAKNIPQRSFIRSTYDENKDKIGRMTEIIIRGVILGKHPAQDGLNQIGNYIEGLVKKKIKNGPFVPLSPATIKRKGSSKPLIDTGHLRQSIRYVIVKGGDNGND